MAKNTDEVIDSQIISEHVEFLDNCFDYSFDLQSSLRAVKEFAEEQNEIREFNKHELPIGNTKNECSLIKSTLIDSSLSKSNNHTQSGAKCVMNKNLKKWGLPCEIAKKYEDRGIVEMFDWQVTCLGNPKVLLDSCNLVYSAPTSAGKTLVAEILAIKTILERQKKVIIILPFVSIVREKMFYLQDILSSSGIRVEGFMGSQSPPGGLQAVHVAISTIEKANSLINKLLDDGNISELGAVIVDELHLLGDPHRGYILELLLTKIKYVNSKLDDVHIQVVGMSATLPNLEVLATWLSAELFVTQFRPIPLDEYCMVGSKCYDRDGNCVSNYNNSPKPMVESDCVLNICLDTIKDGCSVLIFCMTKNRCENLAQTIASTFFKLGCEGGETGVVLRNQLKSYSILEVLEQLRNCPVSLDEILKRTISFGVAYHHAGLTFDERDIIEAGFKSGAIRVLVATSTLSSGVNLPARKVIIRSPVFQRQPINILSYKQMIGRAGRMGRDTKGESILICTENEKKIGFDLMMGALDPVKSCIENEDKYMRAVLEIIASQVVSTKAELDLYSKCTLLYTQQSMSMSQNMLLDKTLKELINFELVRTQSNEDETNYVATPLGKACLSSSMAPNDGLSLFCELQKARQCLVLETDLHLIYLVTPYSVSSQWGEIDWLHLLTLWESLTKAMKRVGELVGVQESFIVRCLRGTSKSNQAQHKLNIHKRFYTALALQDLVNEVPLAEVSTKFQCARGFLQSLQQAAATFAGMVTAFCRQLSWKNMEMLISQFQDRLHFGIHSDLLELMRLPCLNGMRARALFDAGYETIASVASADVNYIENILHKAVPFQSSKEREGDDGEDIKKRTKMKNIWITGCCGMTTKDAAQNLISEARKYLEREIGVSEIKWHTYSSSEDCSNENSCTKMQFNNKHNFDHVISKSQEISEKNIKTELNPQGVVEKIENKAVDLSLECIKTNSVTTENLKIDQESKCKGESVVLDNTAKNCTSTIFNKSENKNILNPSLSTKDDIAWDSLDFTEAAFDNISKVRSSNSKFSPNISFGEFDDKCNKSYTAQHSSVKDVSLFSSDGDNSSLFEDSLPLDLIPSKLLDIRDVSSLNKQATYANGNLDTNSMLNAFKTTLFDEDDDGDGIKLIYEEDNKALKETKTILNVSKYNEVISSQELRNDLKSPFKRHVEMDGLFLQPSGKRKKLQTVHSLLNKNVQISEPQMNYEGSKKVSVSIGKYAMHCILLKGNDIFDNLHIVESIKSASIYLYITKKMPRSNELIGSNIIKMPKVKEQSHEDNLPVKGIAIYSAQTPCLYLDFTHPFVYSHVKKRLSIWFENESHNLILVSFKNTYLYIKKWVGANLPLSCVDVSLENWLIDNDEKIPSVVCLLQKYCGIDLSSMSIKIDSQERRYKFLGVFEKTCIKVWSVWMVAEKLKEFVNDRHATIQSTIDVETRISKILANCEYYGITVDKELASKLLIDVQNSQEILQKKAYRLSGYHFNFNSSKEVAKILGIYNGHRVSTKKSVLETHNSPLSKIVMFWRKLNSILTKTLYPLTEKACIYTKGNRINPTYTMFTCTGRVSMHEPNLQNVPRTFSIPAEYLALHDAAQGELAEFNCRNIFKAAPGHVMVSADYCQLEMRLLTHFSEDTVLLRIMNSNVDVFKSIASSWSRLPEDEVDEDLRQRAKQLCYGILYGMGSTTLAQHLDVTKLEASVFMDIFYKTYPAVKLYTQSVIDECRKKGYVETLTKRRRYLPDINSKLISKKNTAERQAVNTTVQGSAADIAKAAMCAIDTKTDAFEPKPRLLLQMHDELIYEVPETMKTRFISIMKDVMESTVKLRVPLPVKVKSGNTWGALAEVKL